MVAQRGEIWWVDFDRPTGSVAGFSRPVLVVSADSFNESRINTAVVVAITSNLRLAEAPGNVLLAAGDSQLSKDSVVNVSQILTVDKSQLDRRVGFVTYDIQKRVDQGMRLVLDLR
ncbi:MAG: type II toxin-antitoxin system PemK/MazF family toxin [Acidimicrobiales bacterium]